MHPATKLLIALLLFAPTIASGQYLNGPKVTHVVTTSNSFLDAGECTTRWADYGIETVWPMGLGGTTAFDWTLDSDDNRCSSLNSTPYDPLDCVDHIHQLIRVDGACRYTKDFRGAGAEATCLADIYTDLPLGTVFLEAFGPNDINRGNGATWVANALPEVKSTIEAMQAKVEEYGFGFAVVTGFPVYEQSIYPDKTPLAGEIDDWVCGQYALDNPNVGVSCNYNFVETLRSQTGDAAVASLYANCPAIGSDSSFDCTHPNSTSGYDLYCDRAAQAILKAASKTRLAANAPSFVDGMEFRCDELNEDGNSGTRCVGSEPFDHSTIVTNIGDNFDFDDSIDAYELTGDSGQASEFVSADVVANPGDMPLGNTVTNVLHIDSDLGSIHWVRGPTVPPSDVVRRCKRYYALYSTDFNTTGPNGYGCDTERNKMMQSTHVNGIFQLQEEIASGTTCPAATAYKPVYLTDTAANDTNWYLENALAESFTYDLCHQGTGWCRIEQCEAATTGTINSGTSVYAEARITTLSDMDVYEVTGTPGNTGGPQTDTAQPDDYGFDLYHGQCNDGSGGTCADAVGSGDYWLSHGMMAEWTSDAGQWIGCAPEVEGEGC